MKNIFIYILLLPFSTAAQSGYFDEVSKLLEEQYEIDNKLSLMIVDASPEDVAKLTDESESLKAQIQEKIDLLQQDFDKENIFLVVEESEEQENEIEGDTTIIAPPAFSQKESFLKLLENKIMRSYTEVTATELSNLFNKTNQNKNGYSLIQICQILEIPSNGKKSDLCERIAETLRQ